MNTNTVAQSDYAANAYTENVQQTTKKSAVTNGKTIGDPQLSEKAQKYYEQLKKKFSNMDFILVSADKKEEAQANAAQYANANHTVVLIDTDKIEKMAEDEAYRKKYEGIISGAQTQLAQIKNGLGSNASHVKGYGIKINDNGTASLFAVIDKSLAAQKERIAKNAKTRAEEKKAAEKKADKKKTEEKQELKNRLIEGAGVFHHDIDTSDQALEQSLIKPAVNFILLREKAKETLASAEILCSEGKYSDCANRCYYAMMFSLKTLLENKGLLAAWKENELKEAETHNSLESGFSNLVNQGILDANDQSAFDYVKDQRWKCDYSLYKFEKADAENCVKKAKNFYTKVEAITA